MPNLCTVMKCFKTTKTVNTKPHVGLLNKLELAIQLQSNDERYNVVLQHDNDIAIMIKHEIKENGLQVLPHSPYSTDLAPSDYPLFRPFSNNFRIVSFKNVA